MLFEYKAIKRDGSTYEDKKDAKSEDELYRFLKSDGETLVYAREINEEGRFGIFKKLKNVSFGGVKEQDKISFAHNMGSMIEAGLPVARALGVMERQTKNKKFKEIIQSINTKLKGGVSFSEGLEGFPKIFPPIFISMVHAGEESGNLSNSLKIVASQLDKSNKLKKKIRGALMYPTIILIAMLIVGALMLIFIVPTLTATFKELNVDLPMSTQIIISVSDFLKNNTILALILLASLITGFVIFKRQPKGKKIVDTLVLKIPVVGTMVQETNSARVSRTLSSLLTAGVEVVKALEITSEVIQNTKFKKVLTYAQEQIQRGSTMSSIFQENEEYYPALVNEMMAVGEETGKLPEMLLRVAVFYEDEVDQKTKNMSTIIEPFLMVFIGAIVGFFAVSMISPMYSLTSGL